MRLYATAISPFVRKVRIFAYERGVHDLLEIHTTQVSPVTPGLSLSHRNPLQKVPTLELASGAVLYDSRVIVQALDAANDGPRLLPAEGDARWDALRLEALADGVADAAVLVRYEATLRPEAFRWEDWRVGQLAKVVQGLRALDAEVDRWGDHFGWGQIAAAAAVGYVDYRDISSLDEHPRLLRWWQGLAQRASIALTRPA